MSCHVSACIKGGGMTSSTISLNLDDTAQKTVFTATEKCILKLSGGKKTSTPSDVITLKFNNTNIGAYYSYYSRFSINPISLENILTPYYEDSDGQPTSLILYLEEGDTVYATRTSSKAFTLSLYSAVFTF